MGKKVTFRDIAREANVSEATVSFVFNGRPGISEETRQKVFDVADRLDYKYTTPTTVRESVIGILTSKPEQTNATSFGGQLLSGILNGASVADCKIELLSFDPLLQSEHKESAEQNLLQRMMHWKGAIVLNAPLLKDLRFLHRLNIPVAAIDTCGAYPEFYQVDNDNKGGAILGTRHLMDAGHHPIAFVGPSIQTMFGYVTFSGYRQALSEKRLPMYSHMIAETAAFTVDEGYKAMDTIIQRSGTMPPAAVFCTSDILAYGVLNYIAQSRMNIAVVSMDDLPLSSVTSPPLTTVRIRMEQMGETALSMIQQLITGDYNGPKEVILGNELVVRQSCITNHTAQ